MTNDSQRVYIVFLLFAREREQNIPKCKKYVFSSTLKICGISFFFSYPTALAMVASGKVNLKPMITHRFTLERSIEAFETAKRGEGVKIMISCSRE